VEGQDPQTGRFMPGNNAGGRKALPAWLRDAGDELLRVALKAAVEGRMTAKATVETDDGAVEQDVEQPVPVKTRAAICRDLLDRIYGRPANLEHGLSDDDVQGILARLYAATDDGAK